MFVILSSMCNWILPDLASLIRFAVNGSSDKVISDILWKLPINLSQGHYSNSIILSHELSNIYTVIWSTYWVIQGLNEIAGHLQVSYAWLTTHKFGL